jgi:arsenate reductase (glutaredoxin)
MTRDVGEMPHSIAACTMARLLPHGLPMKATIYHNPRCGTSRNTLAILRHAGIQPTVIEYLKTPPDKATLLRLIKDAGLTPRGAARQKEPLFGELGLKDPSVTDEAIIDAMLANPILIERPFVVTDKGTRLARPSEVVLEILPPLPGPFTKEDGGIVGP